jgi:hypothetical protein
LHRSQAAGRKFRVSVDSERRESRQTETGVQGVTRASAISALAEWRECEVAPAERTEQPASSGVSAETETRDFRLDAVHLGIGLSHPAMSAGFRSFTKPLKLYVDGLYGPTRLTSLVG